MRQQTILAPQEQKGAGVRNGCLSHPITNPISEDVSLAKAHAPPAFSRGFSQVPPNGEQSAQRASTCPYLPTRCPYGGACHTCPVQAKLTVSQPNDKYEKEADHIADLVMSMPDPRVQRTCSDCDEEQTIQTRSIADQITPLVQRQPETDEEDEQAVQPKMLKSLHLQRQSVTEEEEERKETAVQPKLIADQITPVVQRQVEVEDDEEEGVMQPKRIDGRVQQEVSGLKAQIHALQGGGQPLPQSERNFFEPRFGNDFSHIRVHTSDKAIQSAQAINARAYTVGQNIMFNANQFAPHSHKGRLLLAHELTHTLQQTRLAPPKTFRKIQRSYCPSHCARPASRGRLCRASSQVRDASERGAADASNRISHIRVLLRSRRVHLFYNGRPRTAEGRSENAGPCNPNPSETPRGWDLVGLKGNEDYTNRNRYNMAWFTAFRSTYRRIGFHNSQPLTGGPSAGCVRVSCELARRINRDSASGWTSIIVR